MGYEVVYDKNSGLIVLAQETAAPRDDVVLSEGQEKLFLDFDFEDSPVSAFRVDTEQETLVRREEIATSEPSKLEAGVVLSLSSDATEASPIDGIPSIPADEESTTTITVQMRSTKTDRPLTGTSHNNLLNLRTTAGALSARQVNLERGQADFTLRSSSETVVAEVHVWAEEVPRSETIRIEFAPTL